MLLCICPQKVQGSPSRPVGLYNPLPSPQPSHPSLPLPLLQPRARLSTQAQAPAPRVEEQHPLLPHSCSPL